MKSILQSRSHVSQINAIEENLYGLYLTFRDWKETTVHDETGLLWVSSTIPFPVFNSVMRSRSNDVKLTEEIENITEGANHNNVPVLWWNTPSSHSPNLSEQLEDNSFILIGNSPGMSIDLKSINEQESDIENLVVEKVTNKKQLQDWCDAFACGYDLPPMIGDAFYRYNLALWLTQKCSLVNYVAYLNGKPVATSSVFYGAGVAGIYNVSTQKEYRRQGIGSAITLKALIDAKAKGYRSSVLISSELGKEVYQSLGYKEHCKVGQYYYVPNANQLQADNSQVA